MNREVGAANFFESRKLDKTRRKTSRASRILANRTESIVLPHDSYTRILSWKTIRVTTFPFSRTFFRGDEEETFAHSFFYVPIAFPIFDPDLLLVSRYIRSLQRLKLATNLLGRNNGFIYN